MQQNEITQELSDEKIDINVAIDNSKISSLLNDFSKDRVIF